MFKRIVVNSSLGLGPYAHACCCYAISVPKRRLLIGILNGFAQQSGPAVGGLLCVLSNLDGIEPVECMVHIVHRHSRHVRFNQE